MAKFDHHFKMNEQDAIEYAKTVLHVFDPSSDLTCKEIGDGNINYIFRVEDKATGYSIIIKHADTTTRNNNTKVDSIHNCIEAEMLKQEYSLVPGLVPEVYYYDPVMCCIVMEDCRAYQNMRHELCKHKIFLGFAEQISHFLAVTLMGTSDLVIPIVEKRRLQERYTNVDLDHVTERLVYTEPYLNIEGKNTISDPNIEFFGKELYGDTSLHLEVAKLYDSFKSNNQCLIHGDLHTGSIMIKQGAIKVIDPEFATYAPAGYDVGNVVANLIFAWVNGKVTMEEGEEREKYLQWLEDSIQTVVDRFRIESIEYLQQYATDPLAKTPGFFEWFVDGILKDAAGVCGLELNRRTVGIAKVEDITSITNQQQRSYGERICVFAAKEFILKRGNNYRNGNDYLTTIHNAAVAAEKTYDK